MEELIQEARQAWRKMRDEQVQQCHARGDHEMAHKLAQCTLFSNIKTLAQLANLIFSPSGVEFMATYKFPNMELWRKLKAYQPERYGIYIDAGQITRQNAKRMFIVGDTMATLDYEATDAYNVVLLHGARATIHAHGYASVVIEQDGTATLHTTQQGHAHIC